MKTKEIIETRISELKGMDFLFFNSTENTWIINDEKSIEEAIKEYGDDFPKLLLSDIHQAFKFLVDEIVDHIEPDLKDIWKRLDNIENK